MTIYLHTPSRFSTCKLALHLADSLGWMALTEVLCAPSSAVEPLSRKLPCERIVRRCFLTLLACALLDKSVQETTKPSFGLGVNYQTGLPSCPSLDGVSTLGRVAGRHRKELGP